MNAFMAVSIAIAVPLVAVTVYLNVCTTLTIMRLKRDLKRRDHAS